VATGTGKSRYIGGNERGVNKGRVRMHPPGKGGLFWGGGKYAGQKTRKATASNTSWRDSLMTGIDVW